MWEINNNSFWLPQMSVGEARKIIAWRRFCWPPLYSRAAAGAWPWAWLENESQIQALVVGPDRRCWCRHLPSGFGKNLETGSSWKRPKCWDKAMNCLQNKGKIVSESTYGSTWPQQRGAKCWPGSSWLPLVWRQKSGCSIPKQQCLL